jgi:hypothetical protein
MLIATLVAALCVSGTAGAAAPQVGAIRWDAWFPGNNAEPTHWVSNKLYTEWPSRQPLLGWHQSGEGVDDQAVMDQEINWAADHGLDYWAFGWYGGSGEDPGPPQGGLKSALHAYMSSPYKSRLRFAQIVGSYWVVEQAPYWRSIHVPDLVRLFRDAQYVRIAGNRPVVYWFGANDLDKNPSWRAELQYLRDQIRGQPDDNGRPLGDPFIIDVTHNPAAATSHGMEGVASYGPAGAVPPAPSGCFDPRARSWEAQARKDVENLSLPEGLLTVPSLTPVNDPRPRDADPELLKNIGVPGGYGYWSQPPTYGQWEAHFQHLYEWASANPTRTTDPPLLLTYAWNELDEGGAGIVPTHQEQFKYLDAIKAVKSETHPGEYTDTYNSDNCSIRFDGPGWIRYPGVVTARDNDLQISWTVGDKATLRASDATGFVVRFNKGPDRGRVGVSIDGGAATTLDLASPQYEWWDYRSPTLPRGTHTIQLIVQTAKQIPVDRIGVRIRRTRAWEFATAGDWEGWSPDHQASGSVSGGALHVAAAGDDAQIYNPSFGSGRSLDMPAAPNRYVRIRMRNATTSTRAALYFTTDADRSWSGTKAKGFAIQPDSGYAEYVLDMRTVPTWKGTIRALRIDPGEPTVAGGRYDIDWIRTASAAP